MPTLSVYVCPGSNQTVTADGAGGCTNGQGAWQQVVVDEPFDPSTLNSDSLGAAFGAGFLVMATGCVLSIGVRIVVRMVRDA